MGWIDTQHTVKFVYTARPTVQNTPGRRFSSSSPRGIFPSAALRFQFIRPIPVASLRHDRSFRNQLRQQLLHARTFYIEERRDICAFRGSMVRQVQNDFILLLGGFYRLFLSSPFYRLFFEVISKAPFDPALRIPQLQVLPAPALAKPGDYRECRFRPARQYRLN